MATKRRQYRSGSVYQRKSDGLWLGTYDHGYTKSGGRKRHTVTAKSEVEAKRKLKALVLRLESGEEVASRTTVKAWVDTWLEVSARNVRPKTHATDKSACKFIVQAIGHKRLGDLTPGDVRALRAATDAEGRSTSTARRYHGVLMRLLKAAQDEGHTIPARVLAVERPKANTNDRQAIPLEDSLALISVAAEIPHGSRWVAALLQGMRQGECLGLCWDQIDLDAETLTIAWQLQTMTYADKSDRSKGFLIPDGYEARRLAGRYHLVRPKSKAGWRVIPLVPWMTQALTAWKAVAPTSPYNLVWPALDGRWASANVDREEWHVMQDTVGVRHPSGRHYTVHEARHATGTLLMKLGVPESVRIQIMGHSTIASTTAYEHVDTALAREALARVAERLQLV